MKKTILYTLAAIFIAAIAAIIVVGCNNGDGGDSAGLNGFIDDIVGREPGNTGGKFAVSVENGSSPGGNHYAAGETVVIKTETERGGQRFTGWTSSSPGVRIDDPENLLTFFIMPPNAVTVTATFAPKAKFTVVYDANGGENAPRDGGSPYDSGTTVKVLGPGDMAYGGHNFSVWNTDRGGDGRTYGKDDDFIITGSLTLYAIWTQVGKKTYTVTIATGTGTGSGEYEEGATVKISATVPPGQTFKEWTSAPAVNFADKGSETTTFPMPASDVTVKANFEAIPTYLVTIISEGDGATGGGSYPEGDKVTIYAGKAQGKTFKDWTVNNNIVRLTDANKEMTEFTMPASAVTVTANFTQSGGTPPTGKPATPTNVKAEADGSLKSVKITWNDVPGAQRYDVYRSRTNIKYELVGTVPAAVASYTDNVTSGLGYYYKVSAGNSAGSSDYSSYTYVAVVATAQKCGTYCQWNEYEGCLDLVADATGNYNGNDYWPPVPTPTCDSAEARCIKAGAGLYDNPTCTGRNLGGVQTNEYCGKYCIWQDHACSGIRTDKNGAYGDPVTTCDEAIKNCELFSLAAKTFNTMEECVAASQWYKPPNERPTALAKSPSALRALYSAGAVTATLTSPSAAKLSGGAAELIDDKTGAVVSTAPVSISGKKAAAVLPVGANVPAGYYTVRVVLTDKSGGQTVEEASIGIVK